MASRAEPAMLRERVLAATRRLPFFHERWNERYGWRAAVALAVLSASIFAFARLAEGLVDDGSPFRWDARFNRWVNEEAWGPLVFFFRVVTVPGNTIFLIAVTLTAAALLWARDDRAGTALVVSAFVGSSVWNLAFKLLFERPRPEFQDESLTLRTFSFPSGHAAVSAAVYGAFALIVLRDVTDLRGRAAVVGGVAALLLLIGASRIYLGAHYFSDVLAGYSIGIAWLTICVLVITFREHHEAEEREHAWRGS